MQQMPPMPPSYLSQHMPSMPSSQPQMSHIPQHMPSSMFSYIPQHMPPIPNCNLLPSPWSANTLQCNQHHEYCQHLYHNNIMEQMCNMQQENRLLRQQMEQLKMQNNFIVSRYSMQYPVMHTTPNAVILPQRHQMPQIHQVPQMRRETNFTYHPKKHNNNQDVEKERQKDDSKQDNELESQKEKKPMIEVIEEFKSESVEDIGLKAISIKRNENNVVGYYSDEMKEQERKTDSQDSHEKEKQESIPNIQNSRRTGMKIHSNRIHLPESSAPQSSTSEHHFL